MDLPVSVKAVGNAVYDLIAAALGDDTVSFAGNVVRLVIQDFTPTPDLDPSTLTYAAHGMSEITSNGTVILAGTDPVTGDKIFKLKPPAGGWHWVSGGGGTYSFVVYGWIWLFSDATKMRAAGKLLASVTVNADGLFVDVDDIEFRLPPGGLT